jgi:Carboxypeptidase regulatory-like domain/TonB dependent receptor-like, beta-barrel/TonB-dependent Receptor Plug Domain
MRFLSVTVLVVLLASAGMAVAQETTGTLRGRISDSQGLAVPGVVVTATGPQGTKTATSDADGRFNLPFLTPGVYIVRAELTGFKATEQKDIIVSLGQTVDLPFKMDVGGVAETVLVTGTSPAIDITTATIGSVLDTDSLRSIPVGRTFAQAVYLTPGVSNSGTVGAANPSISGGTGLENQYVVDGTNVTNVGYGGLGSYSGTFGSLGNATPYDFIKEIQVKTGGYEAEFGQATGGVVNVVTKSGSNQLRGSVFAYAQPSSLQSDYEQYQASNGSVNTASSTARDFGAEGGFAVIKNKLFFFGAIDPSWQTRALTAPAGFPLASMGEVDRNRRTTSYAAKATYQLGSGNRIDASFFGDPSHGETGPQRTSALLVTDTSSFSTLDYGGHQQSVRYSGVIRNNLLVEGSFARSLNKIGELPTVNDWRITDKTVTPNIIKGGVGTYEAGNRSESKQYVAKVGNIVGAHELKYGIQYDDAVYAQVNQLTGPTFKAPDGRQTATGAVIDVIPASEVPGGKIYRVTRANFNSERTTPQTYLNFFAQDTWRVGGRLTVNPGIRYEQETMSGSIIKDFSLKNNWGPRIGVTFDPAGDGRTKVYGNFGVFFARIPNDLAARALSADDGFTRGDYYDEALTRQVPEGTPAAGVTRHFILAGVGADTIDPDARLTYTKEVVAGIDREIMPNTTLGVRYVYRNMPRILEDIANCPMVAYELDATKGICGSVEYILTNPSSDIPVAPGTEFLGAKFDDPVHKYNSVELTLNRRGANWSAMTSYRFSTLRGNFEGFYRDDNGQSDPGISSLYDFPTNDPSYTAIGGRVYGYPGDIRYLGANNGILPLDRPHQIKLYGNRAWSSGLNIGGGINLSSGKPLTPMAANPNYGSSGEIPEAARGTGIDTVDGFAKRTPFESQVDMQASYTLRTSSRRRVTLLADVFNLFNQLRVTSYDQNTQLANGPENPDFGKPISTIFSGNPPQFQAPFNMRVGVRFEF